MSSPALGAFLLLGTTASLAAGWVLVSRIQRVAARLDASEALLGPVGRGPSRT